MSTTRHITANVKVDLDDAKAGEVLVQLLAFKPDAIGLQEWGNQRNAILRKHGRLSRWPALAKWLGRTKPGTGYVWVRPVLTPSSPVGLDASRYGVRRCRAVVLHPASKVAPQPNHPVVNRPACVATEVIVDDYATGKVVVFISYHLDSGVQDSHGSYRTDAAALPDVRRHRKEVVALDALIAHHEAKGREVTALGDSNFAGLKLPGLHSAFEGHQVAGGTEGSRKIDDVFGRSRSVAVQTVKTLSDHKAVVVDRKTTKTHIKTPTPPSTTPPPVTPPKSTAAKVIAAARGEIGYREGYSGGHWNNVEKYAAQVPGLAWVSAGGYAWCAVFDCWCLAHADALAALPGTPTASVAVLRDAAKAAGRFSEYPALGALILYGAKGDVHTGVVVGYGPTTVTTVEGNTNTDGSPEGNGVYLKTHARIDPYIYGYAYPDYPERMQSADPAWKSGHRK